MTKLPLAVDIADTVLDAVTQRTGLDVEAAAAELLAAHPEAEATQSEIVEILAAETSGGTD